MTKLLFDKDDRLLAVCEEDRIEEIKNYYSPDANIVAKDISEIVDNTEDIELQISKLLSKSHMYPEINVTDDYIEIDITHGDWKHDHGWVDVIMRDVFGYTCKYTNVTDSNESDTYSAIHHYKKD